MPGKTGPLHQWSTSMLTVGMAFFWSEAWSSVPNPCVQAAPVWFHQFAELSAKTMSPYPHSSQHSWLLLANVPFFLRSFRCDEIISKIFWVLLCPSHHSNSPWIPSGVGFMSASQLKRTNSRVHFRPWRLSERFGWIFVTKYTFTHKYCASVFNLCPKSPKAESCTTNLNW